VLLFVVSMMTVVLLVSWFACVGSVTIVGWTVVGMCAVGVVVVRCCVVVSCVVCVYVVGVCVIIIGGVGVVFYGVYRAAANVGVAVNIDIGCIGVVVGDVALLSVLLVMFVLLLFACVVV